VLFCLFCGGMRMSCTLILMRHSHAASDHDCTDFERPLTPAGVELATATGQLLNELNVVPDLIVASAAVRTATTAECVSEQFDSNVHVSLRDELYQSGPSAYLPAIHATATSGTESMMVIGHNPAVGTLIASLARQYQSVPPATCGVYTVNTDDWFALTSLNREAATLTHLIVNGQLSHAS